MSDTLHASDLMRWCDDCHGYIHAPWCPTYESDKEVAETFRQSRTAKYPAKVLAELTAAGELNNEQYQRLRRETVDAEQLAARGGGDGPARIWIDCKPALVQGYGYVYLEPPDPDLPIQSNEYVSINQHQSLVAERERLRAAIEVAIHNLNAGNDPKFLADYLRLTLDQKGGPQ